MKSVFIIPIGLVLVLTLWMNQQQQIDTLKEERITAYELQECLVHIFEKTIDSQYVGIGTTGLYVNTNTPYVMDFGDRSTEEYIIS